MNHVRRWTRYFILFGLIFASLVVAGPAAAQDGEEAAEGFPLTAFAAYCEPEHAGPFVGCTPWEGVTVTFVAIDTNFSTSCVTEAGERAATCSVEVPFGSTIEASIDPATVPAGYVLQGQSLQQLTIPDGPPEGEFGGPSFILLESSDIEGEDPADEGDEYVPPVIGDEPRTDHEPATVTSLPSTGTGPEVDDAVLGAVLAIMLAGLGALVSAGAIGLHRAVR
ncbi:MAG TPA: hypothetical protein VGR29_07185 [Thermomicrobiales bacterium]|nr:hypothetical protein [Thermomicrobiales bacterium]